MMLRDEIERAAAPLRRAAGWRALLSALSIGLALLAAAAWASRTGVFGAAAALVLAGWLALVVGVLVGAVRARRARARLDTPEVATTLESLAPTRRGALTTLLAPLASGTSSELHRAALEHQADWVSEHGSPVLAPTISSERRQARNMAGILAVALAGLLLARPLGGAPAMVLRPWQAWQALVEPVRLTASTVTVAQGEPVELEVVALGQASARLQLRRPGETWRDQVVELDAAGRAVVTTAPLDADLVARATAGGRTSREVRVAIRLPVFLGSFTITARYPDYLGLEYELLPTDVDTLVIPQGTRLRLEGRATAQLAEAQWNSSRTTLPLAIDNDSFEGELTPTGEQQWALMVRTVDGDVPGGTPSPLVIRVVPDLAPVVNLPVPGSDTVAPPSGRLPLVVAIEDDHGITAARIEGRRSGGKGRFTISLDVEQRGTDRLLVATALPLDSLGLAAGDTLWYSGVATDNSPGRAVGRSREFMVRIPTAAEQRAARVEATEQTAGGLDSLVAQARQAQRTAEDLSREQPRGGRGNEQAGGSMSAEAARRAEQAAAAQREVEQQAESLQREIEELRSSAEQGGAADSALANQLAEISEMLNRAMSPELRDAMQRLQEALRDLDSQGARQSLADLARQQAQMRQAIERARELFKRAELETRLGSLAEEADDLARQQQRATELLARDSAAAASAEDQLAARADSLADALEGAMQQSGEQPREGLTEIADQVRQAAGNMQSAAQAARNGQRQQAQQQAQAAQQKLDPVSRQIQAERQELQEAMKEEVLAALDRLLMETSHILARQNTVAEALRRGAMVAQVRSEQSMIEEAVGKLFEQVIDVSGKNALISPRVAVALALARDGMRVTIDAIAAASPSLGRAVEQSGEAVDALALAAYSLLRSRNSVEQAESGTGLEEAMQQMQQMAGQQGEASNQGQSMLSEGGQDLQAMMQLAMRQRAIAQQLERMQAQGSMPGAGELAQEALDISRQLEQGRLNPETVERQQRLFRRMLDAGRSLEGDQQDDRNERQSTAATGEQRSLPGALDPALLQGNRFPLPDWDELQRLGPEDRRRVMDYFRRLTESAP